MTDTAPETEPQVDVELDAVGETMVDDGFPGAAPFEGV